MYRRHFGAAQGAENRTSFTSNLSIEEPIEGVVPVFFGAVFNASAEDGALLVARNNPVLVPMKTGSTKFQIELLNLVSTLLNLGRTGHPISELDRGVSGAPGVAESTGPFDGVGASENDQMFVVGILDEADVVEIRRHQSTQITLRQLRVAFQYRLGINVRSIVPASRWRLQCRSAGSERIRVRAGNPSKGSSSSHWPGTASSLRRSCS